MKQKEQMYLQEAETYFYLNQVSEEVQVLQHVVE